MLLKFLRKRKNMKRIMWTLAILIIPAFVIWGVGTSDKGKDKGPSYAGKVFNRKVSFEEYLDMWQVSRDHVLRTFGANAPQEFIDQLAWNRILLLEAAKRKNITVKDSEVVEKIASFPVFQKGGIFDKNLYKLTVGDSARGFEERLKDDMLISKLKDETTYGISISDAEVKEAYKKHFEKIKASYILLRFADFGKYIKYAEPDILRFYKGYKETFRKPEQRNVRYIEIPFSGFDKDVSVTDGDVKRYFEEHLADYKKSGSEEMPVLDDAIKKDISGKVAMQRKKALAEEIAYKILDTALSKKNLDEPSASFEFRIKETGLFSGEAEIPGIGWSYEFTKNSFDLKPGEISNMLIKTDNGLYIIQLKEKKDSYVPDFADAKDSVTASYIKNESVKFAEKKARKLLAIINNKIAKGLTFEDAAGGMGLEIKKTDFLPRSGYIPGLGPAGEFVDAAFSLKGLRAGGPVKMHENWVILKPDEYQAIDEAKFMEEKEDFKRSLLSAKKESAFNEWFEDMKREANFVSYTLE